MSNNGGFVSSFRWLDILEKEFDKSYVTLDMKLKSEYYEDVLESADGYDTYNVRKLLSNLGSCFVQVVHKAQTIFQTNAKLEAELINCREELSVSKSRETVINTEKSYLLCQLQQILIENHQDRDLNHRNEIKRKLEAEMKTIQGKNENDDDDDEELYERTKQRNQILLRENSKLRQRQVEMESELVGARLDAKYLDKELAGRIQQIQILLASGTSHDHKQKVWSQIESEMHLQRSKTISNMCYSKQKFREKARKYVQSAENPRDGDVIGRNSVSSKVKQVHLLKNDSDELGMAILGGKEHGLPIMISEIFPNTAVGRCKKISAGDVILAVNGDSFENFGHVEAVTYLSALRGTIRFDLESKVEDDIEEICNVENRYYDMYHDEEGHEERQEEEEEGGGGAAAKKKVDTMNTSRTLSIVSSYPGKATDVRKLSEQEESLPQVHNSSKK